MRNSVPGSPPWASPIIWASTPFPPGTKAKPPTSAKLSRTSACQAMGADATPKAKGTVTTAVPAGRRPASWLNHAGTVASVIVKGTE